MAPRWLISAALVGAGGFVGSALRYALANFVNTVTRAQGFPFGTLSVNAIGCLAIGILAGLAETRLDLTPEWRLLLLVGLLGGFTTFSTFGYETILLARDAELWMASLNIVSQIALGLLAVSVGLVVSRAW